VAEAENIGSNEVPDLELDIPGEEGRTEPRTTPVRLVAKHPELGSVGHLSPATAAAGNSGSLAEDRVVDRSSRAASQTKD